MDCIDVCYKKVGDVPIHLNVYPPELLEEQAAGNASAPRLPAVCYFHGGALCVGNRTTWFPEWMKGWWIYLGQPS